MGKEGARLDYLDQFRGFTMSTMILVNFIGDFHTTPQFFKHATPYYISYPDTVMTGFLFAAGLSYRLSFTKTAARDGIKAARRKVLVPRVAGLLVISCWLYGFDVPKMTWDELTHTSAGVGARRFFFGWYWEALVQIATAMLWCVLVIDKSISVRVMYALMSQWAYVGVAVFIKHLVGDSPDYDPIRAGNGGPYGFLGWTFPLLAGSVVYDIMYRIGATNNAAEEHSGESEYSDTQVIINPSASEDTYLLTRTTHKSTLQAAVSKWVWMVGLVGVALMASGYLISMLQLVAPFLWSEHFTFLLLRFDS